jgi:hypothetical protein
MEIVRNPLSIFVAAQVQTEIPLAFAGNLSDRSGVVGGHILVVRESDMQNDMQALSLICKSLSAPL